MACTLCSSFCNGAVLLKSLKDGMGLVAGRCLRVSAMDSNGRPSEVLQGKKSPSKLEIPLQATDNVWDTKPAWLQPWTILLSGSLIILGTAVLLQNLIATAGFVVLVGSWWFTFLYLYPLVCGTHDHVLNEPTSGVFQEYKKILQEEEDEE